MFFMTAQPTMLILLVCLLLTGHNPHRSFNVHALAPRAPDPALPGGRVAEPPSDVTIPKVDSGPSSGSESNANGATPPGSSHSGVLGDITDPQQHPEGEPKENHKDAETLSESTTTTTTSTDASGSRHTSTITMLGVVKATVEPLSHMVEVAAQNKTATLVAGGQATTTLAGHRVALLESSAVLRVGTANTTLASVPTGTAGLSMQLGGMTLTVRPVAVPTATDWNPSTTTSTSIAYQPNLVTSGAERGAVAGTSLVFGWGVWLVVGALMQGIEMARTVR